MINIFKRGKTLEGAAKNNSVLLLSNACLSIALLLALAKISIQHDNTVLVPPQLDRSVTVGWNSADGAYIKSFALYVATLAGNITPKNVNFVVDNLSTLVSPRIFTDVRIKLLAHAENKNFVHNAGSTHFSPEHILFEPDNNRVFVIGTMTTDGAGNGSMPEPLIYEMRIVIVDGKPVVDAITNYAGSEPHTESYLKAHADDPKKVEEDKS